ncbi:Fic family protein [Candidatus Saccharibacteria bacterium]|nr:Fic family protein [Candidatus Saccharibacteria bacterium]
MFAKSELVPHDTNHTDEIRAFFGQIDQLTDPAARRDYFEHLDDEDFLDILQQTAQLVRTGDAASLQAFDGKNVALVTHEVPDQREKMGLLVDVWHAAKSILKDRSLSDRDALDYAGLTIAGGTLLVHPFADGNGRVSRTVSYVLMQGIDSSNGLDAILSKSNGGGEWDVAPSPESMVFNKRIFIGNQPDAIEWAGMYVDDADDAFGGEVARSLYSDAVMRHFIEEADDQTKAIIEKATYLKSSEKGGKTVLKANECIHLLATSDSPVYYVQNLRSIVRYERAEAVRAFLRAMQDGDITAKTDGIDMFLRGDSERQRERSARLGAEVVRRTHVNAEMSIRDQAVIMHRLFSNPQYSAT